MKIIKWFVSFSVLMLVSFHAFSSEDDEKLRKLSDTLKDGDRQLQEYKQARRDSWVYSKLAKCSNVSETEFQDLFVRFMMTKHVQVANNVLFDSSPQFSNERRQFVDEFMKKEYLPRAKDFYLERNKCPSVTDLHFDF